MTDFATSDGMPCLCVHYARVTERAALAAARWLGRADQEGAEEAASSGMRTALDALPISGRIAIAPRDSEAFAVKAFLRQVDRTTSRRSARQKESPR